MFKDHFCESMNRHCENNVNSISATLKKIKGFSKTELLKTVTELAQHAESHEQRQA